MQVRIAFILACFVAGVWSKNICISECGAGSNNGNYHPGWRYDYKYRIQSATHYTSDNSSEKDDGKFRIDAAFTIEAISKCQMSLQITQVKILNGKKKTLSNSGRLAYALKKNALFFRLDDGLIDNLCSKDPLWVRNFKRGILSSFHSVIGNPNGKKVVTDVHGRCPTIYSWITDESPRISRRPQCTIKDGVQSCQASAYRPLLRSERNIDSCENHQKIFGGYESSIYRSASPTQHLPLTSTRSYCNHKIDDGIISSARCEETIEMRKVLSSEISDAKTIITKEVEFEKKSRSYCGVGCKQLKKIKDGKNFHVGSLVFEFDVIQDETNSGMSYVKALVCQLTSSRDNLAEKFVELVEILRSERGSKLFKIKRLSCPGKSSAEVREIMTDAAEMTGTPEGMQYILSSRHLSITEKDIKLGKWISVKQPTLRLLKLMKRFVYAFKFYPTAAKATTALIYRFCQNRRHCNRLPIVRDITNYLITHVHRISTSTSPYDSKAGVKLLAIAGNLRVSKSLSSRILKCAMNVKLPLLTRVSAVAALKQNCHTEISVGLLWIFDGLRKHRLNENTELRLLTYKTLLSCPQSYPIVKVMAKIVGNDNNEQVVRFIQSSVFNIWRSQDPTAQNLRMQFQDTEWHFKNFTTDPKKMYSNSWEYSQFSQQSNVGFKLANDQIYWKESKNGHRISRSASIFFFGEKIDVVEVDQRYNIDSRKFRSEGHLAFRLFGHEVFRNDYPQDYTKYSFGRILRSVYRKQMKSNIKESRKPKEEKVTFNRRMMILETTVQMSTTAGLPVRYKLNGATVIKAAMKFQDSSKGRKYYSVSIEPQYDLTLGMEMGVVVKDLKFGTKQTLSGHHKTSLGVKLHLSSSTYQLEIATPKKLDLLSLSHTSTYLIRPWENRDTDIIEDGMIKPLFSKRIEDALGYQFFVESLTAANVAKISRIRRRAVKLYLERMDKHKTFITRFTNLGSSGIDLFMDTPGSTVDRRLVGKITTSGRSVSVDLEMPWRKLRINALVNGKPKDGKYLSITAKTEKNEYLDTRIIYSKFSSKEELIAVGKASGVTYFDIKANKEMSGMTEKFGLTIKSPFREPIKVTSVMKMIEPNRISIGKHYKTTLNVSSAFLKSDVTSTLELSPYLYKSKIMLNYNVPETEHVGSIGAKVSWNRNKHGLFNDNLKGSIAFSQFPHLDTHLTVKSTIVSPLNFRQQFKLLFGEEKTPISGKIDFAYRKHRRGSTSLKLITGYNYAKLSTGHVTINFKKNNTLLDISSKINSKLFGEQVLHFEQKLKYRPDKKPLIDGSLKMGSNLSNYRLSVSSKIHKTMLSYVGHLKVKVKPIKELSKYLSDPFNFDFNVKPTSCHLRVKACQWMGNSSLSFKASRGISAKFSFQENSQLQLQGRTSVRYSSKFFKLTNSLSSKSENIYNTTIKTSYFRKVPRGSLDLQIGKGLHRIKFSFSQGRDHNSKFSIQIPKFKLSLVNKYKILNFGLLQRVNGSSEVNVDDSTKRKFLITTKYIRRLNSIITESNFQMENDGAKDNVSVTLKIKPWLTTWKKFDGVRLNVASSFEVMRNLQFEHKHNMISLTPVSTSRVTYLDTKYDLNMTGSIRPERWRFQALAAAGRNIKMKLIHTIVPLQNMAFDSVSIYILPIGKLNANISTSIQDSFFSSVDMTQDIIKRYVPTKLAWTIHPGTVYAHDVEVHDYKAALKYRQDVPHFGFDVWVKEPKLRRFVAAFFEGNQLHLKIQRVPNLPPFDFRGSVSRLMCSGKVIIKSGPEMKKQLLSFVSSFCDLKDQKIIAKFAGHAYSYIHTSPSESLKDSLTEIKASTPADYAVAKIGLKQGILQSLKTNYDRTVGDNKVKLRFNHQSSPQSKPLKSSLSILIPKSNVDIRCHLKILKSQRLQSLSFSTVATQAGNEISNVKINFMEGNKTHRSTLKSICNHLSLKSRVESNWIPGSFISDTAAHEVEIHHQVVNLTASTGIDIKTSSLRQMKSNAPKWYRKISDELRKTSKYANMQLELMIKPELRLRIVSHLLKNVSKSNRYVFNVNTKLSGEKVPSNVLRYPADLWMAGVPGLKFDFRSPYLSSNVTVSEKEQSLFFRPNAYLRSISDRIPTLSIIANQTSRKSLYGLYFKNIDITGKANLNLYTDGNMKFKSGAKVISKTRELQWISEYSDRQNFMYHVLFNQTMGTRTKIHAYELLKVSNGNIFRVVNTSTITTGESPKTELVSLWLFNYTLSDKKEAYATFLLMREEMYFKLIFDPVRLSVDASGTSFNKVLVEHPNDKVMLKLNYIRRCKRQRFCRQLLFRIGIPNFKTGIPLFVRIDGRTSGFFRLMHLNTRVLVEKALITGKLRKVFHKSIEYAYNYSVVEQKLPRQRHSVEMFDHLKKNASLARLESTLFTAGLYWKIYGITLKLNNNTSLYELGVRTEVSLRTKSYKKVAISYFYQRQKMFHSVYNFDYKRQIRILKFKTLGMSKFLVLSATSRKSRAGKAVELTIGEGRRYSDLIFSFLNTQREFSIRIVHKPTNLYSAIILRSSTLEVTHRKVTGEMIVLKFHFRQIRKSAYEIKFRNIVATFTATPHLYLRIRSMNSPDFLLHFESTHYRKLTLQYSSFGRLFTKPNKLIFERKGRIVALVVYKWITGVVTDRTLLYSPQLLFNILKGQLDIMKSKALFLPTAIKNFRREIFSRIAIAERKKTPLINCRTAQNLIQSVGLSKAIANYAVYGMRSSCIGYRRFRVASMIILMKYEGALKHLIYRINTEKSVGLTRKIIGRTEDVLHAYRQYPSMIISNIGDLVQRKFLDKKFKSLVQSLVTVGVEIYKKSLRSMKMPSLWQPSDELTALSERYLHPDLHRRFFLDRFEEVLEYEENSRLEEVERIEQFRRRLEKVLNKLLIDIISPAMTDGLTSTLYDYRTAAANLLRRMELLPPTMLTANAQAGKFRGIFYESKFLLKFR